MTTTNTFVAAAQYDDWLGTAAADNADGNSDLAHLLQQKGLYDPDKELLVAAEMYVAENNAGRLGGSTISAYVVEGNRFDDVAPVLADQDPIPVRRISLELPLQEMVALFKRFSVSLTWRGLDLVGRRYQHDD